MDPVEVKEVFPMFLKVDNIKGVTLKNEIVHILAKYGLPLGISAALKCLSTLKQFWLDT